MRDVVRRRRSRVALAVVLGALAASALTSTSSAATSPTGERLLNGVRLNSFEARLVADMNQTRVAHGLKPLRVVAGATDVARRWTWHLAQVGQLSHNPKILSNLSHAGSKAWSYVEENVGYGPLSNPDTLFTAYMNSPEHKANILGKYVTDVGVGVVMRGQTAWNTVDFVNAYSTSYGQTRVPADGLPQDALEVLTSTVVGAASHADQRFGPFALGKVSAAKLRFASGRAQTTLTSRNSGGSGGIVFREPLVLTPVQHLAMTIVATGSKPGAVPVAIRIGNGWQSTSLGTVSVDGTRTVTLAVPAGVRAFSNSVTVSVAAGRVNQLGHRVRLSVSNLRAVV